MKREVTEELAQAIMSGYYPKDSIKIARKDENSEWEFILEGNIRIGGVDMQDYVVSVPLDYILSELSDKGVEDLIWEFRKRKKQQEQWDAWDKAKEEYKALPWWKKIFKRYPYYSDYVD